MQFSAMKDRINWWLGLGGAFAVLCAVYFYLQVNQALGIFLFVGAGLGYIESRSKKGLISAYTDFFMKGSRTRLYGLLMLFALGALGALIVHYQASMEGALPYYRANRTDLIIPGSEAAVPVNIGLIVGSFLFGVGLTMNSGCGLGTLRNIGLGKIRYIWPLTFLLIGTIPGQFVKYQLDQSVLHNYAVQVYLPDQFGYIGTFLLLAVIFILLVFLARRYEKYRREKNSLVETKALNFPDPLEEELDEIKPNFTLYFLFKKEWPRIISVLLITALFLLALVQTGQKLAVTQPLLYPAIRLFQLFGFTFEHPAFHEPLSIVQEGLLNHTYSLNNLGIILGAAIFGLTSTKFSLSFSMDWKQAGWSALSGFFMGFGAVLAGGCIVGALYSGVVNLSLSGWVVFASMSLGIYLTGTVLNKKGLSIPTI